METRGKPSAHELLGKIIKGILMGKKKNLYFSEGTQVRRREPNSQQGPRVRLTTVGPNSQQGLSKTDHRWEPNSQQGPRVRLTTLTTVEAITTSFSKHSYPQCALESNAIRHQLLYRQSHAESFQLPGVTLPSNP